MLRFSRPPTQVADLTSSWVDRDGFVVAFDGEAVADNTIDIRNLAPGLIALSEVFQRANELLNPNNVSVYLHVRAIRRGSFEVQILVGMGVTFAINALSSDLITSAANLKELLTGSGGGIGLIGLYKRLRGQTPRVVNQTPDGVVLEAKDLRLSISADVFRLFQDHPIKKSLQGMVMPLLNDGMERMVFKEGDEQIEQIEREDVGSFGDDRSTTDINEIPIDRQSLMLVRAVFPPGGGKWQLHDGQAVHWYTMLDEDFLNRVADGMESFRAGDFLVCQVRLVQRVQQGKIDTDYQVVKVREHHTEGRNLPLA